MLERYRLEAGVELFTQHDTHELGRVLAIAHTIIDLARTLKITANAEGVESQKQLDWLVEQGCGEAQGYWFARPVSYSDVDQFIAAFKPNAMKTKDNYLSSVELPRILPVLKKLLHIVGKTTHVTIVVTSSEWRQNNIIPNAHVRNGGQTSARIINPGSYRQTIEGFPARFNDNQVKSLHALA